MISDKKAKEIIEYSVLNGNDKTCEVFGINIETLSRYKRKYKRLSYLSEINEKYDDNDLKVIASGIKPKPFEKPIISYNGEKYRFALVGDTHFGSDCYMEYWFESVCGECSKRKIDRLFHVGDLCEGMSNRPGHIYEIMDGCLGYENQKKYAVKQLEKFNGDVYIISGNHDRWFHKSSGAEIVSDVCEQNKNWHFLGDDEGTIKINGIDIMLWHGEDGSSYAVSYRIQKICESFTGGEKPNVLLTGHVHKSIYLQERNIHCISAGSLQRQTPWMRGKRLSSINGWWEVCLTIGDNQVREITTTWRPFYV